MVDSVTKAGDRAVGRVMITGSHGGIYAAYLARQTGCRGTIFNDAGVGMDRAGIGGLEWLEAQGMAAAAVDHASADIGNAAQMYEHGRISHANRDAQKLGIGAGMTCMEAARLLDSAPLPQGICPEVKEARTTLTLERAVRQLVLVDSAGLVVPEDAGAVVVTGSHGALFGDNPANALKADAFLALFNDAGGGIGTSRLPILEARGIAAATVAATSARIGDARSTWCDGRISAMNAQAVELGAKIDMPASDLVTKALSALTAPLR